MTPGISTLEVSEEAAVVGALQMLSLSLKPKLITTSPGVGEGENFMSDVIKVDVSAHDVDTGDNVEVSLLLKRLPQSKERRQLFQCDLAFANEAAFYKNVLPFLHRSSPKVVSPLPFPPCLRATPNYILLRHLGQDGFQMSSRKCGLNLQHCLLVLQELARFHATSYAAKFTNPTGFAKVISTLKEWLIAKENPILDTCIDNSIQMSTNVVEGKSSTAQTIRTLLGRGFEVLRPHILPHEPLSVIVHGDLWSNNLLFRYTPGDSQCPSDVCFLDLQVSRYGSPALDILYFLFTSCGPGVLSQHFHCLLEEYHRTLSDHLFILAPQAPVVTLEDITSEVKKHSVFGLMLCLLVLPVVTTENNNFDLNGMTEEILQNPAFQETAKKELLSLEYKRRVNEIFKFCDIENLIDL